MSDQNATADATDFDAMSEADLETHLIGLSAKRDELISAIKGEARAARTVLDAKIVARRRKEVLDAVGLGEPVVAAEPSGVESTAQAGAATGGE